mgnify:CR=1 FL=1
MHLYMPVFQLRFCGFVAVESFYSSFEYENLSLRAVHFPVIYVDERFPLRFWSSLLKVAEDFVAFHSFGSICLFAY